MMPAEWHFDDGLTGAFAEEDSERRTIPTELGWGPDKVLDD